MPNTMDAIGTWGSMPRRINVLAIPANSGWKLYSFVRANNTVGERDAGQGAISSNLAWVICAVFEK